MHPDIVISADQPFPIEVMVFEEDTYRMLSAGNVVRDIRDPVEVLEQAVVDQPLAGLGDLVMRGSRWFGILHDVDREIGPNDLTVQQVLDRVAEAVETNQITAIAMQALGGHHRQRDFGEAISRIQNRPWPDCLQSIWIVSSRI